LTRSDRRASADELILGRNAVREVLRAGRRKVSRVRVAEGARATGALSEIIGLAQAHGIPVVSGVPSERETGGEKAHGVAAEASAYPYVALEDILLEADERRQPPLVLLLDELQDPQNVGTLLRTAEAAGVHGIVLPYRRAAGITPAVVRASSGACEHLLIAAENLAQAIERLQQENLRIVGLDPAAEARPLDEVDLAGPLGLVVGSEGEDAAAGAGEVRHPRHPTARRIGSSTPPWPVDCAVSGLVATARRPRRGRRGGRQD
jgi:23S rRNA (guanosine2251-2'-O)-methyltransferase